VDDGAIFWRFRGSGDRSDSYVMQRLNNIRANKHCRQIGIGKPFRMYDIGTSVEFCLRSHCTYSSGECMNSCMP
jgi:hypothetical protein